MGFLFETRLEADQDFHFPVFAYIFQLSVGDCWPFKPLDNEVGWMERDTDL